MHHLKMKICCAGILLIEIYTKPYNIYRTNIRPNCTLIQYAHINKTLTNLWEC